MFCCCCHYCFEALSLFFKEEITEIGIMNEVEQQLQEEKQHSLQAKSINKSDSSASRHWSPTDRLRGRGALREADPTVVLQESSLLLRIHGHFCEQRAPVALRSLQRLKVSASRAEHNAPSAWRQGVETGGSGIASRLSWSSYTHDLESSTSVANLPDAWHHRVNAGTGGPGVSLLGMSDIASLIFNFYLSVVRG